MFYFRIITLSDGNQVISPDLKTPYESLTPLEMVEYTEMERELALMDKMKRKARQETERVRKMKRNPLRRIVATVETCMRR